MSLLATALLGACAIPDEVDPELGVTADELNEAASAGAPGIGDSLFPTLGNGGYDVDHYTLDLVYATSDPMQPIDGTVTITARATQSLSSFDLDFAGTSFGAITVDGRAATASWDGDELVITPARAIRRGASFTVRVAHFVATPRVVDPNDFLGAPFFSSPDGTAWAGQPNQAHQIFPSNDHPRDKAAFSFRIDVPEGTTAVANGVLTREHTRNGRTVWQYEQCEPMATELAQVVVGAFAVVPRGHHGGVTFRDVVPARLADELSPKLAGELAHMDWLEERVGPYPFETYGSLAMDSEIGFALETQTLSLYPAFLFGFPEDAFAPIMVHELAHQWFGNSVAPANWADVWLNEGHATWYELTFQLDPDSPDFVELMHQLYTFGDLYRAFFGPVGSPPSGDPFDLFNPNVYDGGALVLFALRQQVGDEAFRRIERAWVSQYRGRSASTADFIALASHVARQDLTEFLNAWIYGTTTPAMPGHPDWTVEPAEPPASLARGTAPVAPPRAALSSRVPLRRH